MSVNKVILIGNVGKDPESRSFENGDKMTTFSIATTESYKNKSGERVKNTEWHSIVCFKNVSDIVDKYVKKGDMIYIEGKLKTRTWEDKNGSKHYTTEINADTIRMLGGKKDSNNSNDTPF